MAPHRKTQDSSRTQALHVRVDPAQLERFREVVEADERTVSQDLRRYMAQRIAQADGRVAA